jgi:(E)-4-hydroxy-3-methylbut-2-enyl-diphosphate synthase
MSNFTKDSSSNLIDQGNIYSPSLISYQRRSTIPVQIGDLMMGSDFPIRIQSMTTIDTMDTLGSIEQSIRMIDAGCELVRITAPSVKEAQNLENIRKGLRERGYHTPLVADIHFTPNAAELAARIVEKVRINPGNYADKKRFDVIEYSDSSYAAELDRIRTKFLPLVNICKEYGTAMRIGTNHGSLSDRILSRYGDTPLGMVESALEFLRICEDEKYHNIVISMKASNTQVMVEAYRLLCKRLVEGNFKSYPLHLGVTEAGDGEDGRIKSAVGIGTLLEDGLGDTVRVSLTEDPELEIPVAQELVRRYQTRASLSSPIRQFESNLGSNFDSPINPFVHQRRKTKELANFGGTQLPRVIADFSKVKNLEMSDLKSIGHFYLPEPDKWAMNDLGADYIFTGSNSIDFMLPNGLRQIQQADIWQIHRNQHVYPMYSLENWSIETSPHPVLNFIRINADDISSDKNVLTGISEQNAVLVLFSTNSHAMADLRRAFFELIQQGIENPVIIHLSYDNLNEDQIQLFAPTDAGALLIDGLGDGLMLSLSSNLQNGNLMANSTVFGTLQASRLRISKTEYISCPSCGRTLFDLQETTAKIRQVTDHLKGIKIGIMGCIVNGPGEMADADYGYVGIGKDKIALYRGQEVVKKSVQADSAVDELIQLIKDDGKWKEVEELANQ